MELEPTSTESTKELDKIFDFSMYPTAEMRAWTTRYKLIETIMD